MNLRDVEAAIRPQFVWEKGTEWETSRWVEGGRNTGIMVFVGLCSFHKINKDWVCDYLNMKSSRFDLLYMQYRKFIYAAIANEFTDLLEKERAFSVRLLLKTRLAQSYLSHKFKASPIDYSELVDFFVSEEYTMIKAEFLADNQDGNEGKG